LVRMFFDVRVLEKDVTPNALSTIFSLEGWARVITVKTLAVNWMAASGLVWSALKLTLTLPISQYSVLKPPTSEIGYDLLNGELQLIPFLRCRFCWESIYGRACALYLMTQFTISVFHSSRFRTPMVQWFKGTWCVASMLILTAFSGFFAPGMRTGTLGMLGINGLVLILVALRLQSSDDAPRRRDSMLPGSLEPLTGIAAFADKYRGLKPISVFTMAASISVVHEFSWFLGTGLRKTLYPALLVFLYYYHLKSHDMNFRWNKVLFALTIAHQVCHFFADSYYEDVDQPLLLVDKIIHSLYCVVAIQQFREKKELLSRDPLLRTFNYINKYVFLPGNVGALYVAAFYGNTHFYHNCMRNWAGYCLSTGTAMAYCNNDMEEDNKPNSVRRQKVSQQGAVTANGVQIFVAFAFAVLYITTAGGKRWMADKLEFDWDYAAHLYTAYGFL